MSCPNPSMPEPIVAPPLPFWRSFIDSIPASVAVLDTSLCYVDVSRRWLRDFHLTRQALIGRRLGTIIAPLASAMQTSLQDCLSGPDIQVGGEFQLTLGGTSHWFQWEAQSWQDERQIVGGVIIHVSDITTQKHADVVLRASERRFRTLFQYSPVAYMSLDDQGVILDGNDELGRLLDMPVSDLVGRTFCHFLTEPRPDCIAHLVHDEQIQGEFALRSQSGRIRDTLLVSRMQRNTLNRIVCVHCIVLDISERKQIERELQRLNQAKTDFMTNMSHELRTPLNAINGFSYMIKEQSLGPDAQEKYRNYGEVIYEAGEHLLSLINDILDITSLESAHLALWDEELDLTAVMDSCLSMLSNMAENADISVTTDLSDLPLMRLDARRIRQVVVNLLTNALRFTPPGGHVRLQTRQDYNGDVLLTVQDSGIGMDEQGIATALQPFGQVETSLQRTRDGLGLGLPLSRRLVERHDGTLTIHSTPGQGTTVEVRLPASRIVQPDMEPRLNGTP